MRAEHLYVHVPFCARRCVYCDFSIAVRSRVPVDEYLTSLHKELDLRHTGSTLELQTLYFGGGTPSKLGADGVTRLSEVVRAHSRLASDCEVTLEANPEDVSVEAVRAWVDAGVTRVSLGVQSFDDAVLRWMHRTHDATAARRAIETLRSEGLANFSIDLIFATPSELRRSWPTDLEIAIGFRVPHVSVYGLTVEPHTPLGRWVARHDVTELPEDVFEGEFLRAHSTLTAEGLEHYEVSNYGSAGRQSRHNWAYWRRNAYVGVGPSAHEFDGRARRWNTAPYADWVTRLAGSSDPAAGTEELGPDQIAAEEVYLRLRTSEGLILSASERTHVERWIAQGWATMEQESRLRLTAMGWLRLDALASDLTLFRSRY